MVVNISPEAGEEGSSVYFTTHENTLFFARFEVLVLVAVKSILMYLHDR
jgi:hypothetical protein